MADTVKVVCAFCGKHEWHIAHVPGWVELRCPQCAQNHRVTIDEKGHLYVKRMCYLATAAIVAAGQDANLSPELKALRHWRDERLARTAEGRKLVDRYYASAPRLLTRIEAMPQERSKELFDRIFNEFVIPICGLLKGRDEERAFCLACGVIEFVEQQVE